MSKFSILRSTPPPLGREFAFRGENHSSTFHVDLACLSSLTLRSRMHFPHSNVVQENDGWKIVCDICDNVILCALFYGNVAFWENEFRSKVTIKSVTRVPFSFSFYSKSIAYETFKIDLSNFRRENSCKFLVAMLSINAYENWQDKDKSLTELTTITTSSERTLTSLSERSLFSSKIHSITLQIHDSILVILNYNVNFLSARLLDITVSSWSAVQGTRWLGAHDAFHRGWQFLLQIWTLNNHQKEELLHVSYWIVCPEIDV